MGLYVTPLQRHVLNLAAFPALSYYINQPLTSPKPLLLTAPGQQARVVATYFYQATLNLFAIGLNGTNIGMWGYSPLSLSFVTKYSSS